MVDTDILLSDWYRTLGVVVGSTDSSVCGTAADREDMGIRSATSSYTISYQSVGYEDLSSSGSQLTCMKSIITTPCRGVVYHYVLSTIEEKKK